MGSNGKVGSQSEGEHPDGGSDQCLPFAMVMQGKRPELQVSPDLRKPGAAALAPPPPPAGDSGSLEVLAK